MLFYRVSVLILFFERQFSSHQPISVLFLVLLQLGLLFVALPSPLFAEFLIGLVLSRSWPVSGDAVPFISAYSCWIKMNLYLM